MRVGQILMAAAIPFLLAACDTTADAPDLLAPETEAASYLELSADGGTVTDADLVLAADEGDAYLDSHLQFRFLIMDLEGRASAAGLVWDSMTIYERENVPTLLGYSSSEWEDVLDDLLAHVDDLLTEVPELAMTSYRDKAQATLDADSLTYFQTDPFGVSVPEGAPGNARPALTHLQFETLSAIAYGTCSGGAAVVPGNVMLWPDWECVKASALSLATAAWLGFNAGNCITGNAVACYGTVFATIGYKAARNNRRAKCSSE